MKSISSLVAVFSDDGHIDRLFKRIDTIMMKFKMSLILYCGNSVVDYYGVVKSYLFETHNVDCIVINLKEEQGLEKIFSENRNKIFLIKNFESQLHVKTLSRAHKLWGALFFGIAKRTQTIDDMNSIKNSICAKQDRISLSIDEKFIYIIMKMWVNRTDERFLSIETLYGLILFGHMYQCNPELFIGYIKNKIPSMQKKNVCSDFCGLEENMKDILNSHAHNSLDWCSVLHKATVTPATIQIVQSYKNHSPCVQETQSTDLFSFISCTHSDLLASFILFCSLIKTYAPHDAIRSSVDKAFNVVTRDGLRITKKSLEVLFESIIDYTEKKNIQRYILSIYASQELDTKLYSVIAHILDIKKILIIDFTNLATINDLKRYIVKTVKKHQTQITMVVIINFELIAPHLQEYFINMICDKVLYNSFIIFVLENKYVNISDDSENIDLMKSMDKDHKVIIKMSNKIIMVQNEKASIVPT